MKKTQLNAFLIAFLFAIYIAATVVLPSSQTQTIVKVETPNSQIPVGTPFTIAITLSDAQNLYGVEVFLKWDPEILQATNVDIRLGIESHPGGILHETSTAKIFIAENNLTQNVGEYRLVATSTSPAEPFGGNGNIVKITFNPTIAGTSVLALQSELSDYPPVDRDPRNSLSIEHSTQDSTITVTKQAVNTISPTPQPSSLTPTQTETNPKQENLDLMSILPFAAGIILILVLVLVLIAMKNKTKSQYLGAN